MNKSYLVKITSLFLIWRIGLFIVAGLAPLLLPVFGNRFPYVDELLVSTRLSSWVWSFANFDGVHYITIASKGYIADFTQAFFPLFPILVKIVTFGNNYLLSGLLLSNILFLLGLILLYHLFEREYNKKLALLSVLFLLSFPTAFYFGSLYSESLFLLLTVGCFLAIKKKHYLAAGIIAALASATRIIGVLLMIVLFIELFPLLKKQNILHGIKTFIPILIAPIGLVGYMVYLGIFYHDPLYFLNAQPIFGAARASDHIVLLPQVFFRYSKILLTLPVTAPGYFSATMEFFSTILALIIIIITFKNIRLSYWIFIVLAVLIPTLTGTLSSMPRYILMIFPALPYIIGRLPKKIHIPILLASLLLQIILVSFFTRGYWVA